MIYRFGKLELDEELCEVRSRDGTIRLQRKAFDVLLYLVERRNRVVTKDELLSALWPGCHVSEGALTQVIKTIRHALVDNLVRADAIVTVRGRGFRFRERVTLVAPDYAPRSPEVETPQLTGGGEILRRLASLPSNVLRELEIAAVVGREFWLDELSCCSSTELAGRMAFLEQAQREGLIEPVQAGSAHFCFCQASVQRVLYASVPAERRMEIRALLARGSVGSAEVRSRTYFTGSRLSPVS